MKLFIAISLAAVAAQSALADDARLLLVSSQTTIKSHQTISLELVLYNPKSKPVQAPVLEEYSIVSITEDVTGKLTTGGGTQTKMFDVLLPLQTLAPRSIQHKTIQAEINARPGELVDVYVEIGWGRRLRSNSVLLFCPKTNSPSH
jgi:hypothetical protein